MIKKSLLITLLMAFMAPWAVGQKSLPYSYDFENNNLSGEGWTTSGAVSGTGITNNTYYGNPHSGTRYFTFKYNSTTTGQQYLISPELATSSKSIVVEFYFRQFTSGEETFKVGYSTTTNALDQFTFGDEIECKSYTSYPSSPNFSQTFPAGTKYIAVYYYVYNQYYLSIDDITIEEATSCPKPTNLQASLTTGNGSIATLSWTENGTAANWVLQYGTDANFTANTYTEASTGFVVNGTSISLPLTGLTSDQKYYARVKADCGSETGPWSGTIDFTPTDFVTIAPGTATTQSYLPIATNYKYSISQQIYTASEIGDGGTVNKISFYCASTITRSLKIYMKHTTTETYSNTTGISVAADNLVFDGSVAFTANTWTNITLDNGFDFDGENNLVLTVYDYTGEDIGTSGASFSTCRLDYANYRSLYSRNDDNAYDPTSLTSYTSRDYNRNQIRIVVTPTASCETVPTSLAVSSIDHESAILSWSGDAGTTWLVQYKENGSASWINAYEGSANTCTLTGLDELTTYNAHVKAKCNTTADYVAFDNFTTTKTPCDNPTDFTVSSITVEGATLSWTGGTAPYNVEYKTAASENWTAVEGTVNATSYELTGLVSGTEYMARVQASCQSGEADPEWVYLASNFSTLECSNPTDLSVTKVTYNSFTLAWTAGYSISWDVQYKVKDADSWTSFGTVNTATCTLTNLQENTEYQARVKAVCSSDDWASFDNFTTTERPAIDIVLGSPYTQDYTKLDYGSSLPEGWNTSTSGAWITNSGYVQSATSGTSYYISPVVKISGSSAKLVVSERLSNTGSPTCKIVITKDGGETFDETDAISVTLTTTQSTHTYIIPEAWMGKKLQFAFKYTAANSRKWQIYSMNLYVEGAVFANEGNWNDLTKWTNGAGTAAEALPSSNTNVAINAACTIPATYTAQANNITLGENGSITIKDSENSNENGGQLICSNSVAVKMEKYVTAYSDDNKSDWYTLSTPVHTGDNAYVTFSDNNETSNIVNIENNLYNVYYLDETTNTWINDKFGEDPANLLVQFAQLNNGRGYLYRNSEVVTLEFKGNSNVGTVSPTVTYTETNNPAGFNLIGNPYTHEITWANLTTKTNISNDGFYLLETDGSWTPQTTEGTIAPMEAFLVQAIDENPAITISKTVTSKGTQSGNDQIMFTVKNSEYSDVSYVLFKEGHGLNKVAHRNAAIPMLYVINNGENFAIADMSDDTRVINLGFEAKTMSQYSISLKAQGNFSYMHLYDKLTGEDVDMLIEDSYSFIGTPNDRKDRFVLRLTYNASIEEVEANEAFVYQSGSDIIVNGEGELQVFDMMGRKVMTQHINGTETINVNANGVYIFKMNDKVQKVVVR